MSAKQELVRKQLASPINEHVHNKVAGIPREQIMATGGLNITLGPNDFLAQLNPNQFLFASINPPNPPNPGSLYAPSRAFRLLGQGDGNFVLQCLDTSNLPGGWPTSPLSPSQVPWVTYWATGTNDKSAGWMIMQGDGNLVVYNLNIPAGTPNPPASDAIFASNTPGNPGSILRMQDDGNLVVYNQAGIATWASNTSVRESGGSNVK
jgi:hypothetical protein